MRQNLRMPGCRPGVCRAGLGPALALLIALVPAMAARAQPEDISASQLEKLRRAVARTHPGLQAPPLRHLSRGKPRGVCGEIGGRGPTAAEPLRFWFDDSDEVLWPTLLDDTEAGRLNAEMARILIRIHCG